MYRKTGEISNADGVYHSECRCRVEIRIREGEEFPKCSRCQRDVGWLFTRFLSSGQDTKGARMRT